jgi:hypothetical protein
MIAEAELDFSSRQRALFQIADTWILGKPYVQKQPSKAITYLFPEFKIHLHIPTKRVIGRPAYQIKINLYTKLLSRAAVTTRPDTQCTVPAQLMKAAC